MNALRPSRPQLLDLFGAGALVGIALVGFRGTYDGTGWILAAVVGVLVGLILGHASCALRMPGLATGGLLVVLYFVVGAPAALRSLPSVDSLSSLGRAGVFGWKDLLTTLPPVGSHGPLLAIPYLMGMVGTVLAVVAAERTRVAALPLLPCLTTLGAVLLLGTVQPPALLVQGPVFAVLALAWTARRQHVTRPVASRGSHRSWRFAAAVGMLAVAGAVAVPLGAALPGGGHDRVVLRRYVVPPFDVGQYPSPLASYRRFMTVDKNTTLFTVAGLPKGTPLRIATLDSYDQSVWGAGTAGTSQSADLGFQRVGDTIASTSSGPSYDVTVTLASGWTGTTDRVWLPTAGALTHISLPGADESDAFRYDLTTATAIVPPGLQAGDRVDMRVVIPAAQRSAHPQFDGGPILSADDVGFLGDEVAKLEKTPAAVGCGPQQTSSSDPWQQLLAVARIMRTCGALSHGDDGDLSQYGPGHSRYRLTQMIQQPQLVGDDEQYAALLALLGNKLGIPTRVVVGATPENGVVKGHDLHAWLEVHVADGGWQTIPTSAFMPTRAPSQMPPPVVKKQQAKPVPPPATSKRPQDQNQPDLAAANGRSRAGRAADHGFRLPGLVVALAKYGLPPVAVMLCFLGAVVGVKAHRRRRRRLRGAPSTRIAAGWQEVLDLVRDRGTQVPARATRREQAAAAPDGRIRQLATAADAAIFGGAELNPDAAVTFWRDVDSHRTDLLRSLSRRDRWRTVLNVSSLRVSGLRGTT